MPVLCQYVRVWYVITDVALDSFQSDRFVWKWTPDGRYSASSTYRAFFAGASEMLGAKELWKTKAPPKVKFFFWLALHRRLWTAERRKRHGLQESDEYNASSVVRLLKRPITSSWVVFWRGSSGT
jgi:hypothetical protein